MQNLRLSFPYNFSSRAEICICLATREMAAVLFLPKMPTDTV
nr:MAG TPA: hypothetical protein [Caudoviricetes sp.]DAT61127.1 MAG TPA: hypothetical protein [Caudoviricetes sp.]